ncbi:MAG: hypothetical protein ACRD3O_24380, partial [Terriglobia bacterium]
TLVGPPPFMSSSRPAESSGVAAALQESSRGSTATLGCVPISHRQERLGHPAYRQAGPMPQARTPEFLQTIMKNPGIS